MITEHKKEKYSNKKKLLNIISHTEPIGIDCISADSYSYKDIFNRSSAYRFQTSM